VERGIDMLQVIEVEITKLKPWEDNPRLNSQAVDAVAESIRSFDFNVPILCDQNMTIIAGHTRWKAAQKLGLEKAPTIMIEMTDAKRRAFAVADNARIFEPFGGSGTTLIAAEKASRQAFDGVEPSLLW
jgi:ParB/RepB/Spo0J family partition protein